MKQIILLWLVSVLAASGEFMYAFTNFAGKPGGAGLADGMGTAARFYQPFGVTVDGAGNAYVADSANHIIRKITALGLVTTVAGSPGASGTNDGLGSQGLFNTPRGVGLDSGGNLYVADYGNATIRKITPAGYVTTVAGIPRSAGTNDGPTGVARFGGPTGIVVDRAGNLYVADHDGHTLRKITPAGVVSTLAGTGGKSGTNDGPASVARFNMPTGLALDTGTNILVADYFNHAIRKVTPAGVVSTLAGLSGTPGGNDGTGAAARFTCPAGVTFDSSNNLYVADQYNQIIRKVTSNGVVTTVAGLLSTTGISDGTGTAARFAYPAGTALDRDGNLLVADQGANTIRKVTLPGGVVTTVAGMGPSAGTANGTGAQARFYQPIGAAVDGAGNVYVAELGSQTIRKVTSAGVVSTLAGAAGSSGTNDGTGSAARFTSPIGLALDSATNLYVGDSGNNLIRKITPGGVVTTLAGMPGYYGSDDGAATNASFYQPAGVAVDGLGNVYVADSGNQTIRKISSGVVTTLAGSPGTPGSADGRGTNALFNGPSGVRTDAAGNVFVADTYNHTIRKITPAGLTTTVAGLAGQPGAVDGIGTAARFSSPTDLTLDGATNLYVADSDNNLIRKITPDGMVTTIGGLAGSRAVVEGIGAAARFSYAPGIAASLSGTLYIVDAAENVLIVGTPIPVLGPAFLSNTVCRVSSPTLPGRTFTLEYKNTVTSPSWTSLPSSSVLGDGATHLLLDPGPVPPYRFYRVRSQ